VVAGVDGSDHSLTAAAYAAGLAARRGLELHLVHGYLHPFGYGALPLEPYPTDVPDPSAEGARMLNDAANELRAEHPNLLVRIRQAPGGPSATLVDESRRAELIVVGSRGHGGFAGLLLGSVSAQVAAHAHCPVVVVRPFEKGEPAEQAPVLVGVDDSDGARLALEFAFEEASLRNAPLVATHVYWARARDSLQHRDQDVEPAARQSAERLLTDQLTDWRRQYPQVAVEPRLVHSLNIEYAMIEASADAGLVVVGSHGRGGFAGMLLGSVSQTLVHHARCPVAVVHPRSHRE
jgi:nucleotide-binding universal stress UspA family protein